MREAVGVVGGHGSATLTFLFTDIEGSTARWELDGPAMAGALAAHDEQLRDVVQEHRGAVFKHTGDGVCAAASPYRPAALAYYTGEVDYDLELAERLASGASRPAGTSPSRVNQ